MLQVVLPKNLDNVRDVSVERDVVAHEVRSLGEASEGRREDTVPGVAQKRCYSLPAPTAVPGAVHEDEIARRCHDLYHEHGACPDMVRSSQAADVMDLHERWDGAIAQLTDAMRYVGPSPTDPVFALEFASLARAAKPRATASQFMLHGSRETVTTLRARLNVPEPLGEDKIVDIVILPVSHEAESASLRDSVGLLERSVQERPNAIYLVNNDIERVTAVMQKIVSAAHTEIGYAMTPAGEPLYAVTKQYAHDRDIVDVIGVVYVFSTDGRLLLQQRTQDKTWDHSAAGHLAIGEQPIDGAARELWEELQGTGSLRAVGTGIAHPPPGFTPRRHFFHCYTLTCDGPFELDPREVLAVRWATPRELEADLARDGRSYAGGLHATYAWLQRQPEWTTR
jgi:8-oxo-dGTP pyrophosphatase MutT (NUDIX family)